MWISHMSAQNKPELQLSERELWNAKYRARSHTSLKPDPFLLQVDKQYVQSVFPRPGAVLDVAGGAGRHALYYAKQSWDVTLIDVSEAGIALAEENLRKTNAARQNARKNTRKNAGRNKLHLETMIADLTNYDPRQLPERFDVVLVFYYLERKLFPALADLLKPGGLLIYKTYLRGTLKGPTHPLHLLEPNELLHAFPSLRVLHYHETIGESRVAEFVGIKK